MKVAFAGKGGVGKTTLAALFIKALAKDGGKILAVDCDPVSNLGRLLGVKDADKIPPIVEMKKLISERMETSPDRTLYKLNPKVDDIPEAFAKKLGNISLIVMGTVKSGGSGCMCPESNFLKALLGRILLSKDESVVMDMEAGVEHLGRATAGFVDVLFVVVEPNLGSIEAAKKIAGLARGLRIKRIYTIVNKVRKDRDKKGLRGIDKEGIKINKDIELVKEHIPDVPVAGRVPFDERLSEFELGSQIDIERTDAYEAMATIYGRYRNTLQ